MCILSFHCWLPKEQIPQNSSTTSTTTALTLRTFKASSQTCIPLDSNTSTQPKYLTAKVQVPERTADSSACHWCGLELSGTRSFRLRKESLKDLRNRSIFRGDLRLLRWKEEPYCNSHTDIWKQQETDRLCIFYWSSSTSLFYLKNNPSSQ